MYKKKKKRMEKEGGEKFMCVYIYFVGGEVAMPAPNRQHIHTSRPSSPPISLTSSLTHTHLSNKIKNRATN
jgi:hypothetical protein